MSTGCNWLFLYHVFMPAAVPTPSCAPAPHLHYHPAVRQFAYAAKLSKDRAIGQHSKKMPKIVNKSQRK